MARPQTVQCPMCGLTINQSDLECAGCGEPLRVATDPDDLTALRKRFRRERRALVGAWLLLGGGGLAVCAVLFEFIVSPQLSWEHAVGVCSGLIGLSWLLGGLMTLFRIPAGLNVGMGGGVLCTLACLLGIGSVFPVVPLVFSLSVTAQAWRVRKWQRQLQDAE